MIWQATIWTMSFFISCLTYICDQKRGAWDRLRCSNWQHHKLSFKMLCVEERSVLQWVNVMEHIVVVAKLLLLMIVIIKHFPWTQMPPVRLSQVFCLFFFYLLIIFPNTYASATSCNTCRIVNTLLAFLMCSVDIAIANFTALHDKRHTRLLQAGSGQMHATR